jgi:hypothetical protein
MLWAAETNGTSLSMCKIALVGESIAKFIRAVSIDLFGFQSMRSGRITLMETDAAHALRYVH